MAYRLVYNTLDTPTVIDDAGRTVGGYEHGIADSNLDPVKQAVDLGALVLLDDVDAGNGADPRIVRLSERARAVEVRRARLMRGSRADLHRMAEERGLSSEQTDGALAAELALDDTVEVPEPDDEEPSPTPTARTRGRASTGDRRTEED